MTIASIDAYSVRHPEPNNDGKIRSLALAASGYRRTGSGGGRPAALRNVDQPALESPARLLDSSRV